MTHVVTWQNFVRQSSGRCKCHLSLPALRSLGKRALAPAKGCQELANPQPTILTTISSPVELTYYTTLLSAEAE